MSINTPIHKIAKDLGIDSNRVISACKTLGIYAKGSSKKLNEEEISKILNYFESGKNVSEEVVTISNDIKDMQTKKIKVEKSKNKTEKINYFSNRLIG